MTTILALDTVGPSLGVALTRGERTIYQSVRQTGHTHSQKLMVLADEALREAGISPGEVDCFAVTRGPGSFTGVRIGVATAKALAQATDRPCLGVNALEALARPVRFFPGVVCPLQDARGGQIYCAAFIGGERLLPDAAMALTDFLAALSMDGQCLFAGDGAAAHAERLSALLPGRALCPPEYGPIDPVQVAAIARGNMAEASDWRALQPYYLRAPQAERERAARLSAHAG